jgi:YVTN family beta-propeller protein
VIGSISTPGAEPSYAEIFSNFLFVSSPSTNQMLVINTTTNTITNVVNVGSSPSGIAYYSGNGVIYIGNNDDNTINVISYGSFNVTATITNANSPLILELVNNSANRKLYFSNQTAQGTNIGVICIPPPE